MIKFTAQLDGGRKLVGFGLSRENCERLLKGEPITFEGEEVGENNREFVIFGGETEQVIQDEITEFFTGKHKDDENQAS